MTCHLCRDRLTELLEGELAPEAERATRAHLAQCSECARAFAQMQAVVTALHGLPEVEPPEGLRERLRAIPVVAAPPHVGGWRRVRYVVATVAAAAAALLMIWTGTTHFRGDVVEPVGGSAPMLGRETPRGGERTSEPVGEAAAPAEEMVAEVAVAEEEASAEAAAAGAESEAASEPIGSDAMGSRAVTTAPARERHATDNRAGGDTEDAGRPAAGRSRAEPAPAPLPSDTAGGPVPLSVPHATRAATGPGELEMSASAAGGAAAGTQSPTGSTGPAGLAGPAGPMSPATAVGAAPEAAREAVADEGAMPSARLAAPEPQYLDAGGSKAVSSGTGEGSPFVVSVMPPHRRIAGTIVPATITVETEEDVARARLTVEGSATLELVNIGLDGVLYDGPLAAGQRTVLSLRMLAREPGAQSITMRLRSTDPIVDTRLEVRMGEFVMPVPPEQRTVTFDFTDTPVREAIDSLVRQSGLRVVIDQRIDQRAVTIAAPDPIPAAAAVRSIAAAAGCAVREADGALIIEPLEE